MTLLVPFDGSELAGAALVRATGLGEVFDEGVLAVSVIPDGNAGYARQRGWLDPGEPFDREAVVGGLRERVAGLAPDAEFRAVLVSRRSPSGTISGRIRRVAREEGASMVVVGSDNAGSLVRSVGSVGRNVAADAAYDVLIVRHTRPAEIEALREASGDG